ncbi:uncharacterized protein LOC142944090 isoform X1 [Anarhichas minor]|uniref:uncharacterized protein LOC142944090 isoform X1 n=1 Tax=Anarhichas minor TaxID=65739 RepID=UPI003F73B955
MDDFVRNKLTEWKLSQLIPIFEEHEIDTESLYLLNDQQITELIPKMGPRSKLEERLKMLKKEQNTANPETVDSSAEGRPSTSDTSDKVKRKSDLQGESSQRQPPTKKQRLADKPGSDSEEIILSDVKNIMRCVSQKIPHEDNKLNKFLMKKISDLETDKREVVGVFGKTGAGKSYLINAVIGVKDLLPSGNFRACTSVMIKVEANMEDSYEANIEFITKEEWKDEMCFSKNFPGNNVDQESNQKDDDDRPDIVEKLSALYGEDWKKKSPDDLIDCKYFEEIPEILFSKRKILTVKTAEELSAELVRYTRSNLKDGEGKDIKRWYWPLVKCVTIKVPNNDLLKHVTLVDLPGNGDRNKSRNEMWKKLVGSCSTVWIVTEMNRAASEREAWEILESASSFMGNGGQCQHIHFICTKSDVTKPKDHSAAGARALILKTNDQAKKEVREEFSKLKKVKKHFSDQSLKVFTVSSHEFLQKTYLDPDDTEIPKLQKTLQDLNDCHSETLNYVSGAHGILSLIQGASRGGGRKHVHHLKKYGELTSTKRKRAPETPSTSKQTTLVNTLTVSQRSIDKAVVKYVVQGLQPFCVVEQEPFRDFVKQLQPNAKIMTRLTLRSMIDDASKGMKKAVTEAMRGVDHIATTTDCWSVRRRSFIGVTAHWIDPDSLKRCSAALACKQLRGSHTFDVLANALNDIHSEFEIRGKIQRTTTDNGSNFIKAFQVFGEDENNNAVGSDGDASQPGEDQEDQEGGEEVEFVDVSALLNEDDGLEFQLPKHQRCACHLLNLIATVDAQKATSTEAYKKVYRSTFGKCNALWNKCGRSTLAAETVEDACSLQLLRPNATRWNSLFLAVERLLRIIKDKGEGTIRVLCTDLKVPMFNPAELAFLTEYAAVMSPVAQATNILQAEANAHMGWLLPTINLLTAKLDRVKLPLKYCKPLVDALQVGIKNRFGHMSGDPELIAAAILLPKFRTTWTKDDDTIRMGMDYIKQHMEEPSLQLGDATRSSSSDEDDFFSALRSSQAQDSTKQLDGYLACSADHMHLLKSFPAVCKLSV